MHIQAHTLLYQHHIQTAKNQRRGEEILKTATENEHITGRQTKMRITIDFL